MSAITNPHPTNFWDDYDPVPGNNTQSPPAGAPEGWSGSAVNDTQRQAMAAVRQLGDYVDQLNQALTALATQEPDAVAITGGTIDAATLTGAVDQGILPTGIDGSKIAAGSLPPDRIDLAGGGLDTSAIADLAITTAKIAADAVTSNKIAAGAVDTAELAADAVTRAKVADDVYQNTAPLSVNGTAVADRLELVNSANRTIDLKGASDTWAAVFHSDISSDLRLQTRTSEGGAIGAQVVIGPNAEEIEINGQIVFHNGRTGAIGQTHIAANAIGQGEFKTSSGTVAVTDGLGTDLVLPGGQYGFYPQIRHTANNTAAAATIGGDGDFGDFNDTTGASLGTTAFVTNIRLVETSNISGQAEARQRYVTASPPFDLGDGPMRGFVFVLMRGGVPIATYLADVPPWAYNGPTDIRAKVDKQGRKWRLVPKSRGLIAQLRDGRLSPDEVRERRGSPEFQGFELEELTEAIKNADMGLIPHPFASAEPGDTVVLLDPMDDLVAMFLEAQDAGEDVSRLIHAGRVRPDNEALPRKGPPGVMQARIRS